MIHGRVHRRGGWFRLGPLCVSALRDEPLLWRELAAFNGYPKMRCKRIGRWLIDFDDDRRWKKD